MSAYVLSPTHIDYMVQASIAFGIASHFPARFGREFQRSIPVTYQHATAVGRALLAANIASVSFRYPDCTPDNLPGPIVMPTVNGYRCTPLPKRPVDPVVVLKAVASYEYQSCEHPDWHDSDAKDFCDALRHQAISALPGYDEAPWEL